MQKGSRPFGAPLLVYSDIGLIMKVDVKGAHFTCTFLKRKFRVLKHSLDIIIGSSQLEGAILVYTRNVQFSYTSNLEMLN